MYTYGTYLVKLGTSRNQQHFLIFEKNHPVSSFRDRSLMVFFMVAFSVYLATEEPARRRVTPRKDSVDMKFLDII